jgi:plastocyanin
MRKLSILFLVSVCALGCGDDGDGDTDASGTQGSSSSGGGEVNDNGCSTDGYVAATAISFGGELGTAYDPRCVSVPVGGTVTWSGDFGVHPIVGGYVAEGMMEVPDPESPIGGTMAGQMELPVKFDAAGVYPFFCDPHGPFGMNGAVKVE